METKKIISGIVVVIVLLGGAWLLANYSNNDTKEQGTPIAEASVLEYDWGEIGINDGDVTTAFTITNQGDGPLNLSDGQTSCSCTEATLRLMNGKSREFGMHNGNKFSVVVEPGEVAELSVIYDPLFHGPQGTGPITRQVALKTNDPNLPILNFTVVADVVAVAPVSQKAGLGLSILPATYDFGTVIYGDIPTTQFEITNDTSEVVSISKITTSCSCTTAKAKSLTLSPGLKTMVDVAFNPAIHKDDSDLGELTRTIFIETDSVEFPKLTAEITANVIKE